MTKHDRLPQLCPAPRRSCSPQTGVIACSHYGSGRNPFEDDRLASGALDLELSTARATTSRVSPRNGVVQQARQFVGLGDAPFIGPSTAVISPRGTHRNENSGAIGASGKVISPTHLSSSSIRMETVQQEYDAFYSSRPPLLAMLEKRRKVKVVEDIAPPPPPPPNRVEALKLAIARFEEGPQCAADAFEFSVSLRSMNQNFTYP